MKLVDEWGDPVKPWSTHMMNDGSYWTITDICHKGDNDGFEVGAVFEGGDPEEDGDYFTPTAFGFEWVSQ